MGVRMKLLLSVGAIALTLTFSANAQRWDQQGLPEFMALFPDPDMGTCLDILRLESLQADPQTGDFRINLNDRNQMVLYGRYRSVTGWLRGFFTAMNAFAFGLTPPRDVTKDIKDKDWMAWIYSYCRSHPKDNLVNAALELAKTLSSKTP